MIIAHVLFFDIKTNFFLSQYFSINFKNSLYSKTRDLNFWKAKLSIKTFRMDFHALNKSLPKSLQILVQT